MGRNGECESEIGSADFHAGPAKEVKMCKGGAFSPQDPCQPSDPCREQGLIVGFDDPETIGTFDIAISRVPEPGTLGLFAGAVVILLGRRRRSRPEHP